MHVCVYMYASMYRCMYLLTCLLTWLLTYLTYSLAYHIMSKQLLLQLGDVAPVKNSSALLRHMCLHLLDVLRVIRLCSGTTPGLASGPVPP